MEWSIGEAGQIKPVLNASTHLLINPFTALPAVASQTP
jgi:hypothetical protein